MKKITIDWVPIKWFEGKYIINKAWKVFSINYRKTKNIKTIKQNKRNWYLYVGLSNNWTQYMKNIHRLVATAFIPNSENKLYINHKDWNKENNNIDNLERCTSSENNQHAYDTSLRVITNKHRLATKKYEVYIERKIERA